MFRVVTDAEFLIPNGWEGDVAAALLPPPTQVILGETQLSLTASVGTEWMQ